MWGWHFISRNFLLWRQAETISLLEFSDVDGWANAISVFSLRHRSPYFDSLLDCPFYGEVQAFFFEFPDVVGQLSVCSPGFVVESEFGLGVPCFE